MKRLIILAIVLLLVIGCGGPSASDSSSDDSTDRAMQDNRQQASNKMDRQASDANNAKADADQSLVNFKCSMGGVQDYYFYKNKMKLESPSSEGWIIDDIYYFKMDIGGKDYLVTGMMDDQKISNEDMMEMYKTSKAVPNMDCTLGAASAAIVTLPDLEILNEEEFGELMGQAMFAGGSLN